LRSDQLGRFEPDKLIEVVPQLGRFEPDKLIEVVPGDHLLLPMIMKITTK
jgi:hypothetical protein